MNTRRATDGNWLTQASPSNERNRSFVREVAGFGDLDAMFVEWTDAQKQEWEEAHPEGEPDAQISDAEALDIITGRTEA